MGNKIRLNFGGRPQHLKWSHHGACPAVQPHWGHVTQYYWMCKNVSKNYVMESARRSALIRELPKRVQETPLVIPRLYLLVTAGSVLCEEHAGSSKGRAARLG